MFRSFFARALALLLVSAVCLSSAVYVTTDEPTIARVSAAGGDVHIGYYEFEIVKWNPLDIDMVEDWVGCFLIFSPLFQYDDQWGGPFNDLATGYSQDYNPDGSMTTTITITENAYFRNAQNPTDTSHQLTTVDVEFTYRTIMENVGGTWDVYLRNISAMNIIDDFTIEIVTDYPKATLIDDLSSIPIIPEYQWGSIQPSQILKAVDPEWLVGSGPFIFSELDGTGAWFKFAAGPNYHGAADFGEARDIDFDNLVIESWQSVEALVMAQNAGELDCIYMSSDPGPFEDLGGSGATAHVMKYAVSEPGICDVAINAIPLELRTSTYGNGHLLLLDPIVREALMMTLDKNYLVNNTLMGYGVKADSVLHPTFWQKDIWPELEINNTKARQLLVDNGYGADSDGDELLEATSEAYPVQMGWVSEGAELSGIRLRVPDTNPTYADVGQVWDGDAEEAGIGLDFEIASEGVMISKDWYQADYDVWVWGWGWGAEPLSSLSVWLSSELTEGGDNCQMPMGDWYTYDSVTGVVYSSFDENYSLAQQLVDKDERKVIVDNLQQMIYDSYTENPPFYDLGLYGMTDQRYTGWGEWDTHVGRALTSSLPWVWFDLEPVTNQRPLFDTGLNPLYEPLVNAPTEFSIVVHDIEGDEITVNWTFGDDSDPETVVLATDTDLPTTVTMSHTYTSLASGLYLNVTLDDGFSTELAKSSALVNVVDIPDHSPTIKSITHDPASPVYVGDEVTWTGVANDSESDVDDAIGLLFTWEWDDDDFTTESYEPIANGTDVTDVQTHSWSISGTKYVKLWVYDGYDEPDNELHNVSSDAIIYEVFVNQQPASPVLSPISGPPDIAIECIGSGMDVDATDESLRFTWDWGDGSESVFDFDNTAPGEYVTSSTTHTWDAEGTFSVVLYVDDLTGAEGHNVSASVDALISSANTAPSGLMISFSPTPLRNATLLTCNVSAIDYDGDDLLFYVSFGDMDEAVASSTGGPGDRQYVEIEHIYDYPDTYEVILAVNDSTGPANHNVSVTYEFTVSQILNYPPLLNMQSAFTAEYNRTFTVQPISVSDADGDSVTVWYDWGDGSDTTEGDAEDDYSAQHVYASVEIFDMTVTAADDQGNEVVRVVPVNVMEANFRPSVDSVVKVPVKTSYGVDETIRFDVTVRDVEGDTITVEIDFGDGSDTMTEVVEVEPNTPVVLSFNHSFSETSGEPYDVVAYASDGMDHSDMTRLSSSTTVTVEKGGISTAVLAGIALAVLAVIVILALLLMKRKKGKASEDGSMEGMTPPEPPPQA